MRLQLRAYSTSGTRLEVIEQARNISLSNDGSLTFSLPKSDPASIYFRGDICIGVEIEALAGMVYGPLTYSSSGEVTSRFFYSASDQSRTDKTGVWTYTAISLAAAVFPWMRILPELGHKLTYAALDTPYTVIANRVAEAKARGLDFGITVVDGGGWLVPNVATNLVFDSHSDLGSFYSALQDGSQAELVWVGSTLYVLAPGAMTIDRSLPVIFQTQNFSDVPVKIDRTNLADTILAIGDGTASALYPAAAPGKIIAVQFSGVTDPAQLLALAQIEWASRQSPAREITGTLALGAQPNLVPFRDYHVGTIVSIPSATGELEPVGVAQITLTRDIAADFGGNVVFDTKIKNRDAKVTSLAVAGSGGVPAINGSGAPVQPPISAVDLVVAVQQAIAVTGDTKEGFWTVAPAGWLATDGAAVSRTTYAALFTLLGTTYGAGDGVTTFNLPDTRGTVLVHKNAGTFSPIGFKGGAETHAHPLSAAGQAQAEAATPGGTNGFFQKRVATAAWDADFQFTATGGSAAASAKTGLGLGIPLAGATDAGSTLPPFIVINRVIKY